MTPQPKLRSTNLRLGLVMGRAIMALVTAAGVAGLVEPLLTPHRSGSNPDAAGIRSVPLVPAAGFLGIGDHHDHADADSAESDLHPGPALAAQLAEARRVVARWPTAADALAAGWTLAAPYESHIGAHYMHFADIDSIFDINHPEMLLYGGNKPTSRIVGLAYYVLYHQPSGFAGPTDHWHQHLDVCIGPSGPLVGADGVGICATTDTRPVGAWAWMLHVWVAPGWASPQGVFSTENQALP
jgi:hypothetical protein